MVVEGAPAVLTVAGIWRDFLDDFYEHTEMMRTKLEAHGQRLAPYKETPSLSELYMLKNVVNDLAPERIAALIAAFEGLNDYAELVGQNLERYQHVTNDMERLNKVREHLHTALDGVVP